MILQYKGFNENWVYEEAERITVATIGFDPMWKEALFGSNLISLGKERQKCKDMAMEWTAKRVDLRSKIRIVDAELTKTDNSTEYNQHLEDIAALKAEMENVSKEINSLNEKIKELDNLESTRKKIKCEDEISSIAATYEFIEEQIKEQTAFENLKFIGIEDVMNVNNFTVVSLTGKDKNITYIFDKSKGGVYLLNDSGKTVQRL